MTPSTVSFSSDITSTSWNISGGRILRPHVWAHAIRCSNCIIRHG
jgi:hypothetical protein